MSSKPSNGKMGFGQTVSMAAGFCVGAGVITLTGIAIGMTGRSVVISYFVTALTFMVAVLPALMMCIVYPRRSGYYVYSKELLHPKVAGVYQYTYFLGRLAIAMFGMSCAQYLSYLIPAVGKSNLTLGATAVVVLTIFYIVNLFGTKAAAKVQDIMFYILVAGMVVYIVVGMTKVDFSTFFTMGPRAGLEGDAPFFVNGFGGVWNAASLLVFAIGGCGVLVDFGDTIDKPSKTIPKVAVLVTIGVMLAYACLGIVSAGTLPFETVAFKPLTFAAASVFGEGSVMFAVFIIGTCLMALVTTMNSSFLWYSNASMRSCQDGWFPKKFAATNKYGAPWIMMTTWYLFGLAPVVIGLIAGADLNQLLGDISKMAVAMVIIAWTIPTFALVNMPKKLPEEWKASPFAKVPTWVLWVLCSLASLIYVTQAYSNLKNVTPALKIVMVVYTVVALIFVFTRKTKTEEK